MRVSTTLGEVTPFERSCNGTRRADDTTTAVSDGPRYGPCATSEFTSISAVEPDPWVPDRGCRGGDKSAPVADLCW